MLATEKLVAKGLLRRERGEGAGGMWREGVREAVGNTCNVGCGGTGDCVVGSASKDKGTETIDHWLLEVLSVACMHEQSRKIC